MISDETLASMDTQGVWLGQYMHSFVPNPDEVFTDLLNEIEWEQRETARAEHYSSDLNIPYTYGKGPGIRTYHPHPYHRHVLRVKEKLETTLGTTLDVCFLNLYHDGSNHLGWHADDSPVMDDARPIITVSLGQPREIWFRPQNDREAITKIMLGHGSMFAMRPGLQDTHYHRIPKAGFSPCGPRISLTFRGYVEQVG